MFATFTAMAPQAPTPRVNSPLAAVAEAALLIGVSIRQMHYDFSKIGALALAMLGGLAAGITLAGILRLLLQHRAAEIQTSRCRRGQPQCASGRRIVKTRLNEHLLN